MGTEVRRYRLLTRFLEVKVMIRSRRPSLLIVLAHPDDEIFHGGVLALPERTWGARDARLCHRR